MAYLASHFDRCTGCGICQLQCSASVHGGFNPRLANLVIRMSDDALVHYPIVCHQCSNAFCEQACPFDAIYRAESTGALMINHDLCTGCGVCADTCPIGMLKVVGKKAFKCDLCQGTPKCVAACPVDALELIAH